MEEENEREEKEKPDPRPSSSVAGAGQKRSGGTYGSKTTWCLQPSPKWGWACSRESPLDNIRRIPVLIFPSVRSRAVTFPLIMVRHASISCLPWGYTKQAMSMSCFLIKVIMSSGFNSVCVCVCDCVREKQDSKCSLGAHNFLIPVINL